MRMHPAVRVAPLLLLALGAGACPKKDDVARLEELPPAVSAKLHAVPNTALLIALPAAQAVNCGTPTQTRRPCASRTEHRVHATLPVTICYPPEFPTEILRAQSPPGGAPAPQVPAPRTFKLTVHGGKTAPHPLRCVTRAGPFFVTLIESEDCSRTVANRFVLTSLLPCPGCPPLEWCGSFDNHPPELKPFGPVTSEALPQFDCDFGDPNECGTGFEDPEEPPPPPGPL